MTIEELNELPEFILFETTEEMNKWIAENDCKDYILDTAWLPEMKKSFFVLHGMEYTLSPYHGDDYEPESVIHTTTT